MTTKKRKYQLIIVGGGPIGLYAGFYAGLRGIDTLILEVSSVIGGQSQVLYASKEIYDLPGLKTITGSELTNQLIDQINSVATPAEIVTECVIKSIKKQGDVKIELHDGLEIQTQFLILATGNGGSKPVSLENIAIDPNCQIAYSVKSEENYNKCKLVILGGGDSALDWAIHFTKKQIPEKTILIHRRESLRANKNSIEKLKTLPIETYLGYEITEIHQNNLIIRNSSGDVNQINFHKVLVQYGNTFVKSTFSIEGIIQKNNRYEVNSSQQTAVESIYAIGNCCIYEGKLPILVTGMGEAATAISEIAKKLFPDQTGVFYSTKKDS